MFSKIVPRIIDKYSLDVTLIGDAQKGYRNESYPLMLANGVWVNLLFYKREPYILQRIETADRVASRAAADGLAVRTRYDKRLLRVGNGYAGVYQYLPGSTISWEAYSKRHIKLAGWAMADLHAAMEDLPDAGPALSEELLRLIERMRRYFMDEDIRNAILTKLGFELQDGIFDGFEKLVSHSEKLTGQQYLHMDMVRGNMLFEAASSQHHWRIDTVALSGIIDFEKTSYGLPICDIARTLAFLLVDCPKPADKIFKYFVDSGYRKRGNREIAHLTLLPAFIRLFLVHDLYKFLRHTPYESLRHNYHYTRTSELLKTYGIISART